MPRTLGRLTLDWTPEKGLTVTVDGIALVRQSTLYVVKKGWTGLLFDQRKAAWSRTDRAEGMTLTAENDTVAVRYELRLAREDTLTVALHYRLKRDLPAEIEYAMAYLNANLLAGARVTGDGGQTTLSRTGAEGTQAQRRVGPPLRQRRIATPLGALQLGYTGTAPPPVLFDARKEAQAWAAPAPVFWLGIGSPAAPVRHADGERSAVLTLALSPPPVAVRPDAFVPIPAPQPRLIPRPKQVGLSGKTLALTPHTSITVGGPGADRAIALLAERLRARLDWIPAITPAAPLADTPARPEGYALQVGGSGVQLSGHDAAGTLWAAQTLLQLLDQGRDGPVLHQATIHDWPTLAFRGVHLFHGRNALPFHQKLLDRIYSPFKLNYLVVQCEQLRWEADPTVAPSWGGTPAAVRQEVAYARARGITLVPLVQSYGHMEWLFSKPENRAFAEDPALPYAVNITNPAALDYLGRLVTEADTVFGAPAFHAGLDEVTMRGRFPFRSAPRTFVDLFVSNATYWRDFHQKRGKQLWMWADMLLHPSEVAPCFGTAPGAAEAKAVRDALPKDIVVFDWQYGALASYPSLQRLKDAGFSRIVASTWFNPENIQGFSKAAAAVGAWGGLQTTWCGYESREDVLEGPERRQFTAMVLAAEHFWNGGATAVDYDPDEVFARAYADPARGTATARAGTLLPLPAPARWEGRPADLPARETRLGDGVLYALAPSVTLLQGQLTGQNAPLAVRLVVPAGTRETRLLLVASHRAAAGTVVGTLNGQPLVYGRSIAALEDPAPLPDSGTVRVWQGRGRQLRAITVNGDQPLVVTSAAGEIAPVLLAATALR